VIIFIFTVFIMRRGLHGERENKLLSQAPNEKIIKKIIGFIKKEQQN
jgi:hypothetical protein